MLNVLLEFAMFPTSSDCRDGASVSEKVSRIIDMIDDSGVKYQLTPMGTIIEVDSMDKALDIIKRAYESLDDCERVYSALKFDIRKTSANRLKSKIASIESKLDKKLKT